jgi:hypothetical protein
VAWRPGCKIGDGLLWILTIHPSAGIKGRNGRGHALERHPRRSGGALRKERSKLRLACGGWCHSESGPAAGQRVPRRKVVSLDTSVVSSDVHEFTELLSRAKELKPTVRPSK